RAHAPFRACYVAGRDLHSFPTRRSSDLPAEWPALAVKDHTIVVGYGRVGRQLALLLRDRGVPVVVVEEEADLTQRAREEGLLVRSEEHTSELQSRENLVCRLLLEKKKKN